MNIFISVFTTFFTLLSCSGSESSPQFEPIAVIELFTSQGCSSCPPADLLLSHTIEQSKKDGRKIFALEFHVDYWNRLGWSDPFSDKKYSDRQNEYAAQLNPNNIYTPQMIVNGKSEFVGSDKSSLNNALESALKTNAAVVFKKMVAIQPPGKPIHIQYEIEGNYAGCEIHFALVSLREKTSIKRGENGGKVLQNENVVRQFITAKAANRGEIDFADSPFPDPGNRAVVAFVQQTDHLNIIGAASTVF